jgi:hypothetical protein
VSATRYERADISKLVRPEDFRRSLLKMITLPRNEFMHYAKFLDTYNDCFLEAGYKEDSPDREVAVTVLAAFSHALFERVY